LWISKGFKPSEICLLTALAEQRTTRVVVRTQPGGKEIPRAGCVLSVKRGAKSMPAGRGKKRMDEI
jgi:hypothetical protein